MEDGTPAPAAATSAAGSRSVSGESVQSRASHLSESEQNARRKQIRDIMKDSSLNQQEKNKMIQTLMDGRRRGSVGTNSHCSRSVDSASTGGGNASVHSGQEHQYVSSMARVAVAAAEFYNSDGEGDAIMSDDAPEDIYGYNHQDARSVASSVSHTSNEDGVGPNLLAPGQYRNMHGRSYSLQEWNEESRAAAAANLPSLFAASASTGAEANPLAVNRLMEQSRPECRHYDRNCTIIAPCCGLAFGCRICHDECPVLPPPIHIRQRMSGLVADQVIHASASTKHHTQQERRRSMPMENEQYDDEEENHHLIDRFQIREVICRQCFTRQSSKTDNCKSCGVLFGTYHCSICNLWMSNSELPYHCSPCGFCRVGGRENFRHCRDCGMCIDTLLFDDHNCKAGKYNSNCPVCQEDLFSSRQASHEMPCGHAIHWHCFKELTSFDTRCPVCKKTAETPEQMASTWSALAMGIALQPVPPDLARVVNVVCNDCEERDYERRWHFLGVRCMHCLSFNTNVEQIILQGPEAAQYLDTQEAARGEETGGVPPNISALARDRSGENDDDAMMDDDDDIPPPGVDTSSGTS
mmetsp:Transcript_10873/g.22305  ORF Transcript_10873/g.22305 Transcript_10873/m.22305 type:complete len:581 (-) Transcript_10873:786-2528(-)